MNSHYKNLKQLRNTSINVQHTLQSGKWNSTLLCDSVFYLLGLLKSSSQVTAHVVSPAAENVQKREHSSITRVNANSYSHYIKQYNKFLRCLGIDLIQDPAIPLLDTKKCSIIFQRHLINYVHSNYIHNSQNLEKP